MLRRFFYLDTEALDDYVSVLEDGLRQSRQASTGQSRDANAGVAAGPVSLGGARGRQEDTTIESSDTSPARFDRLLRLAQQSPEQSGWLDLATLDELSSAGYGALVDFECELHVPDITSLLGQADQLQELGSLMTGLRALSPLLGDDMSDLPDQDEVDQLTKAVGAMKVQPVVVGDSEDSDWQVVGVLTSDLLRCAVGDLDGPYRVTAKVGKPIKRGEHKLLLNLPGVSLLPRDQRRAMERQGPTSDGEKHMFIPGPARVLDVLAIYR